MKVLQKRNSLHEYKEEIDSKRNESKTKSRKKESIGTRARLLMDDFDGREAVSGGRL